MRPRSSPVTIKPSDDVIAHLVLMRADEPSFWRRANQHAPPDSLQSML